MDQTGRIVDADGYGFESEDRSVERLLADFRTLSPAGVERAAWGWDRHVGTRDRGAFREAEERALKAIEDTGRGAQWDQVRRSIYNLTEGDHRAISWEAEHGDVSHKSEHAAYGAALALVAGRLIDSATRHVLMQPMAEALPWLLPDVAPEPQRDLPLR
jgi:hypothetical protein